MSPFTAAAWIAGVSEALATLARNPLRAALAGLAMAVAVATTAVVQTGLDGLARSARLASALRTTASITGSTWTLSVDGGSGSSFSTFCIVVAAEPAKGRSPVRNW